MTVSAPTFSLYSESGSSDSDFITNHTYVRVDKESSNSTFVYSFDGGTTWSATVYNNYFYLTTNTTYAVGDIQIKQTDEAGNVSEVTSNTEVIEHDSIAGTPEIALFEDTGTVDDNITNDRTVNVTLTDDVASWKYSLKNNFEFQE